MQVPCNKTKVGTLEFLGCTDSYKMPCTMKDYAITMYLLQTTLTSFHSKKLDIFGFRANIVVISSRVIFFFNLSGWATYHFCKRNFP